MESMRKLQPQLDALTKKYENDKEKLNMERMRLFQENKVNPFGGCLPLIIQMPVWIAHYQTLLRSFELYKEPLLSFWITDLTAKDPYYILPLAMGVTMFITQKMQPQMGDPTQAKIMLYFMPIFFTFLMLSLPAGLTLYIFTNNLLSIAQQKYLQRKFKMAPAPAAAPAGKKKK
jgi:YidC/Oxa1 family membrane protein insertase